MILLVEDNLAHAELVQRSLEDHHISARMCHVRDGDAALDYLLRHGDFVDPSVSPRPDLILLDLRLPGVAGLDLLRTIKESDELRSIPTVVLTTSSAETDVAEAYKRYANSYLVKPGDFQEHHRLIGELASYWLNWNHSLYSQGASAHGESSDSEQYCNARGRR